MSIWSSMSGFDLRLTADRDQYTGKDGGESIEIDVATSPSSDVIRLAVFSTTAGGMLDLDLYLTPVEVKLLANTLTRALAKYPPSSAEGTQP